MVCPDDRAITVSPRNPDLGGEIIEIHPEKARKE
jgi:hypothetical protein